MSHDADSLLGTILVRTAACPADDVDRALSAQRLGDVRNLGELLIAAGLAPAALVSALDIQAAWREGDVPQAARAIVAEGAKRAQDLAESIMELVRTD